MHADFARSLIRTIPDFPKAGIMFRDITTLLADPKGFRYTIDAMLKNGSSHRLTKIVAIEARGFSIGGALAYHSECGLVLARKKGKLPGNVRAKSYDLEYGTDCIEIHEGAIQPDDICWVVDDLIATGGTALATCQLIEEMGATVGRCSFIVNLPNLGGADRLSQYSCDWLFDFEGE